MKRHIISAVVTFISSFLTVFGAALALVPYETWTQAGSYAAISALVFALVRGAIKPAFEAAVKNYFTAE